MATATPSPVTTSPPPPSKLSQIRPGLLTMVFFIGSEVMLFASFFAAYFFIRFNVAEEWPPRLANGEELHLPILLTGVNTAILVASSFTIHWGEHRFKHYNDRAALKTGLIVTIILGTIFLVVQLNEYAHLEFGPDDTAFAGAFFTLTGFHGAHVLLGVTILSLCLVRVMKGDFTPQWFTPLQAGALYWHFVDVVWVLLFILVYLM